MVLPPSDRGRSTSRGRGSNSQEEGEGERVIGERIPAGARLKLLDQARKRRPRRSYNLIARLVVSRGWGEKDGRHPRSSEIAFVSVPRSSRSGSGSLKATHLQQGQEREGRVPSLTTRRHHGFHAVCPCWLSSSCPLPVRWTPPFCLFFGERVGAELALQGRRGRESGWSSPSQHHGDVAGRHSS